MTKYDLKERTLEFGREIVLFSKNLPRTSVNFPLISQLTRSGTSIGANYHEADGAESKNDFIHKLAICRKEEKETQYWLKIITAAEPTLDEKISKLEKEVQELILIFCSIINKTKAS